MSNAYVSGPLQIQIQRELRTYSAFFVCVSVVVVCVYVCVCLPPRVGGYSYELYVEGYSVQLIAQVDGAVLRVSHKVACENIDGRWTCIKGSLWSMARIGGVHVDVNFTSDSRTETPFHFPVLPPIEEQKYIALFVLQLDTCFS